MAVDWIESAADEIAASWRDIDEAGAQTSQICQSDVCGERRVSELVRNIIERHYEASL